MRTDPLIMEIEWLTRGVRAIRIAKFGERENEMALELKGLRGKAVKAASNLDRLNQAYDAFNEAAPVHAADVEGLTPQIAALQDDLTFATQVLGNSVTGSSVGAKEDPPQVQKSEPPASQQPGSAASTEPGN